MTRLSYLFLALGAVLISSFSAPQANAQLPNHYPAGAEGIRPGSIAPPGNYTKLYNLFYWASDFNDIGGNSIDPNFKASTYLGAIRHFWISDYKILGADYGMDIALPIVSNDVEFSTPGGGTAKRSSTGFGDFQFQPVLLSWHGEQWDLGFIYGIWFPTGDYDAADPSSVGRNHWTNLVGLGTTWYPDKEKTWSIAAAQRLEWHTENEDLQITPGMHYSLEGAIAKKLTPLVEVAAVGTIIKKLSDDKGSGVTYNRGDHDQVFGAGAEVTYLIPKAKLLTSLRWFHEFDARARPEGNAIWFSVTRFW